MALCAKLSRRCGSNVKSAKSRKRRNRKVPCLLLRHSDTRVAQAYLNNALDRVRLIKLVLFKGKMLRERRYPIVIIRPELQTLDTLLAIKTYLKCIN